MAAGASRKRTTGTLAVPDQRNPPGYQAPIVCDGIEQHASHLVLPIIPLG